MRLGQHLLDKPVISLKDGRNLGVVRDLYLDPDLRFVSAVYLGSEGLIKRRASLINRDDVALFGEDALLARETDVVHEEKDVPLFDNWLRRQELQGWSVATRGGTKIGQLGDVILDDEGRIAGFRLSQVSVAGPMAEKRAISRSAVISHSHEDSAIIIDLAQAEQEDLSVVYPSAFAEPVVTGEQNDDATQPRVPEL